MVVGGFIFGLPTAINLFFNGLYFSSIVMFAIKSGLDLWKVILLTLPHGIPEITGMIFAGSAGFKIPYEIIRYLTHRKDRVLTWQDVKEYLILTVTAVTLIIIAAVIEAYVTGKIAETIAKQH